MYETHDSELHIARIAAYFKSMTIDRFPVRWASDLNWGYGTPIFIFYYPLPYLFGSILHFIHFSYTDAFKILLGTSFVAAPICFYLWMKSLFSKTAALSASFLYGLSAYHFLDLYVRGDIGELFAFVWIPLIFVSIEYIIDKEYYTGILLGLFTYALLILSHNAMALLFSPVFAMYVLFRAKEKQTIVFFAAFILCGLLLTCFFWIPALFEQKFTHSDLFLNTKYLSNFVTIQQLFWSPWGLGKEVIKPGGLSPQIGPIHILTLIGSIIAIFKLKSYRRLFVFSLFIFSVGVFLAIFQSAVLWEHLALLKKFEFPWRMTALSTFGICILSGILFSLPKGIFFGGVTIGGIIILAFGFFTSPNIRNLPDSFYETFTHSTEFGAASTKWTAGDPFEYPKSPIVIIGGDGTISNYIKKGNTQTFLSSANEELTILSNTLYYPGWHVYINGIDTKIQFQDPNNRGFITFSVFPGIHSIRIRFEETRLRQITNLISFTQLLAVVASIPVYLFIKKRQDKQSITI